MEEFCLLSGDKLVSFHRCCKGIHEDSIILLWYSVKEFVLDTCVGNKGAPSVPVDRLLGRSGFEDYFGHVKDAASDNIYEAIYLGRGLV